MDTVTQNYSDFVSTSKRTKEVPVGKVMRLESEGRLDLIWNLPPGSEVVNGMAVTELLYPVAGLGHEVARDGEDDSEVVWDVEALARQREHALLPHQRLHDLEVILELGEEAAVDADHHVHGARGHHRPQPRHLAQHPKGHLRVVLHHLDGR